VRSIAEQTEAPASCVTKQAKVTSAPLPIPYNVSPENYLADLYTVTSMQVAFTVLADQTAYPVYFHCYHGVDRTGVLAAVILLALGASRDAVMAEYELTGAAGTPNSLMAVLDEIERIGGIDAYFQRIGVSVTQVEAMRKILIVSSGAL
jgi:protein-tyrosine phosphatase